MSQSQKEQEVEAVVKSAIVRLFGEDALDRVVVLPTEYQAGEDGLSVTVFLKTADEEISGARLLDAIAAVSEALRDIDDRRFPYVTFLAPGYQHAEEGTRSAA
jgi:hypothetical protein